MRIRYGIVATQHLVLCCRCPEVNSQEEKRYDDASSQEVSNCPIYGFAGGLIACDDQGPAEEAGENIDDAAEDAGESMEELGEDMEESAEN